MREKIRKIWKKTWKKIQECNTAKRFQIITSVLMVIVSVFVILANISGVSKMGTTQLLNLIIALLSSVVVSYVINEIDVFEEIKKQIKGMSDEVKQGNQVYADKIEKENEAIQSAVRDIKDELAEVNKLVKDNHTTKGVIIERSILEKDKNLDEVWKDAEEVYLMAIANTSFLKGNGISRIEEAVNRGIKFKVVCLNPGYKALDEYKESGIISQTSLPACDNVNNYINNCKNDSNGDVKRKNDFKTMVELRLTTYLLPYSMMIVKKNGNISTIKIDLYGLKMRYRDRRSFYIPYEDEKNIEFYEKQWKTVWNDRSKTVGVDFTKKYVDYNGSMEKER